jgi:uncharacterized protein (UPF0216 family)
MPSDKESDGFMSDYLKGELRTLNAQLPRRQKSLGALRKEEHPHVDCNDGSPHYFKKDEIEYLAEILDENEQSSLMLPIILEIKSDETGIIIRSKEGIEAKIFTKILGMEVSCRDDTVRIFKPQLGIIRKTLKTTTQYVFL